MKDIEPERCASGCNMQGEYRRYGYMKVASNKTAFLITFCLNIQYFVKAVGVRFVSPVWYKVFRTQSYDEKVQLRSTTPGTQGVFIYIML